MKNKSASYRRIAGIMIFAVILVFICFLMQRKLRQFFTSYAETQTSEQTKLMTELENQKFQTVWMNLEDIAANCKGDAPQSYVENMNEIKQGVSYGIIDLYGNALVGEKYCISDFQAIQDSFRGNNGISYNEEKGMLFTVPICHGENVKYVLYALYDLDVLNDNFLIDAFDEKASMLMVTKEEQVILSDERWKDTFQKIRSDKILANAYNEIFERLKINTSAAVLYQTNDAKMVLYMSEIRGTDFYLFGSVPLSVVDPGSAQITLLIFWVFGLLMILFVVGMLYLLSSEQKIRDTEALRMAKREAESANQAKSDFLANMSHEIRTPMNAISGLTEFIIKDTKEPQVKEEALEIKSACNSLLAIINDILDFSKIEAGKMELIPAPYQVSSLLCDVYIMIKMRLGDKPINLVFDIAEDIPFLLDGDEIRIKQILINLLNNAVKFTQEGEIRFSLGWEKTNDPEKICLRMSVSDTGIGIKKEDLDKLFSSFSQVDTKRNRTVEGTGLGLAITKRLVEMMDGTIQVESEYGRGTTFHFCIYSKVKDSRPMGKFQYKKQEDETFEIDFVAPKAKILVVDDNLVNLKVIAGYLKYYKVQVIQATSGKEALNLYEAQHVDLVFMDHMMPVMDGVEAMHMLRLLPGGEKVPIVALTANAISGVDEMYLKYGFNGYLAKPIDTKILNSTLKTMLPSELIEKIEQPQSMEKMTENTGIDEEILRQVYLDGIRKIPAIKALYESGDWKGYTIEVHALKSVAATIGEEELSEMAKSHEAAGKEGDIEFIQAWFDDLILRYQELIDRLAKQFADSTESQTELQSVSEDEIQGLIKEIKNAVMDFDTEKAAEDIEKLNAIQLGERQELAVRMKEAMDLFDYDTVEALIEQMDKNA